MSFDIFDDDFDFFGSWEDAEEEKGNNKPILKKPPDIKRKSVSRCIICGAEAKEKCEYCPDMLCGQYHCIISHNDIKKHLKKFIF